MWRVKNTSYSLRELFFEVGRDKASISSCCVYVFMTKKIGQEVKRNTLLA